MVSCQAMMAEVLLFTTSITKACYCFVVVVVSGVPVDCHFAYNKRYRHGKTRERKQDVEYKSSLFLLHVEYCATRRL
jgi:hypothetical protein